MRRPERTDERAISVHLSHVFAFAITSLLLVVVLTTAATFVENERADVASVQLETVGNELATALQRVDRLARRGGNATVRTTVPATVSGMEYAVSFERGPACQTPTVNAENCLVLETLDTDVRTTVPVANESALGIESEGGGVFVVTATSGPGMAPPAENELTADQSLRVGVADDFEVPRFGTVASPANTPPVAGFDVSPDRPDADDTVVFNATQSFDNDGTIVNYTWNFSDGSADRYGENVTKDFDPGTHNVTLVVEDDNNATTNITRVIPVSGLVRTSTLDAGEFGDGDTNATVNFTVRNEWSEDVEITQVMVDPADDDIERLSHEQCGSFICQNEVFFFDIGDDGTVDERREVEDPVTIRESGLVYDLGAGEEVTVGDGEVARVSVGEFQDDTGDAVDMRLERLTVGFRYEVDGVTYVSTFNATVTA